jgi:hypothetical protein
MQRPPDMSGFGERCGRTRARPFHRVAEPSCADCVAAMKEPAMRYRYLLATATTAVFLATPALAGWHDLRANDTGGIIPWSESIALTYRHIATDHCARFDKIAVITSVHRRYGEHVGFRCYFPRRYDPRKGAWAAAPAVRVLY